jgi:hypothetical protein
VVAHPKLSNLGTAVHLSSRVCLAVAGRLIGSLSFLMIRGSGLALAVWDLIFLNEALGGGKSSEKQTRQYENKYFQSLALGLGLLTTFLERLINLHPPFVLMILFVVLIIFGLDHAYGYIKETKYTHRR